MQPPKDFPTCPHGELGLSSSVPPHETHGSGETEAWGWLEPGAHVGFPPTTPFTEGKLRPRAPRSTEAHTKVPCLEPSCQETLEKGRLSSVPAPHRLLPGAPRPALQNPSRSLNAHLC